MDQRPSTKPSLAFRPLVPLRLELPPPEVEPPSLFDRMISFVSSMCTKLGNTLKRPRDQERRPRNEEREAIKASLREEASEEEIQDNETSNRLLKVRRMAELELQNRDSEPSKFKKSLQQFRTLDIQILNEVQLDDSILPYRNKNKKPLSQHRHPPSGGPDKKEHSRKRNQPTRSSQRISTQETKDEASPGKKSSATGSTQKKASNLLKEYQTPEVTANEKRKVKIAPKSLEFSFAPSSSKQKEPAADKYQADPKHLSFVKTQVEVKETEQDQEQSPSKNGEQEETREVEDTKHKNEFNRPNETHNEEQKEEEQPQQEQTAFSLFGKKTQPSLFSKAEEKTTQEGEVNTFKLSQKLDSRKQEDTVLTQDEEDVDIKMKEQAKIESPKEDQSQFNKSKFDYRSGWSGSNLDNVFGSSLQQQKKNRELGVQPEEEDSIFGKRYSLPASRIEQPRTYHDLPTRETFKNIPNPFSDEAAAVSQRPAEKKSAFVFGNYAPTQNPFQKFRDEAKVSDPFSGSNLQSGSTFNRFNTFNSVSRGKITMDDDDDLFGDTGRGKRYKYA